MEQAKTDKKCEFCQKVTLHNLTVKWENGWVTYEFECTFCGFTETIEYDESRR
jgi:hypothetical protein